MRGVVTVFATDADLSVKVPFIVKALFFFITALPYIALVVSLLCMIVRKWAAAAGIAIFGFSFAATYMGMDYFTTILLLVYSVPVCIISVLFSLRNKRLEPQQEETSESVVKENNNSYKLEDKNDDWDFL